MTSRGMKRIFVLLLALVSVVKPAWSALKPGDLATDFTAQASLAGNEFNFSLAEALKRGPVVLYFYPAAFTEGCTCPSPLKLGQNLLEFWSGYWRVGDGAEAIFG